ncbi:MAG: phospholipid carrier-dependent glycosyltransferase [Acidobacteria bacterium]|nr:MAG: phospholipid carrier-dependent glycosyltransferase [Acidobacteriota bacterium]
MFSTTERKPAAIAAVLLVALGVRVWGLGFGLPFANARPDETAVAGPAAGMLTGDFRPPNFNKPTLFVYAVSAAYAAYFVVTSPFSGVATVRDFVESRRSSIAPFLYISRALSALFGVLTAWWLYGLARRVTGNETVALVAAGFQTVAFLPARDSHFGVTDVPMAALVVLAVREIVAWRVSGGWRRAAIAGAIGGLAMSVKYNGLGVVVPFAVAGVLTWRESLLSQPAARPPLVDASLFALALAATFVGGSPFVLIEWPRFLHDITAQEATLNVGHGVALARGWWQHAAVTLPASLGWPLFVAGLIGAIAFLLAEFRKAAVVLAFPIAYYVVAGYGHTVFARYMLPVMPFLCLAAAWAVVSAARVFGERRAQPVALAAAVLIAAPSGARIIQTDYLLGQTDNRVIVAGAVAGLVHPGESLYQSGASYGHVQLPHTIEHIVDRYEDLPDWILVQRSPLTLYSAVPDGLRDTISARYRLVESFPVADDQPRLYDQQDAFFLPLNNLGGVTRPGPAFELYRKR